VSLGALTDEQRRAILERVRAHVRRGLSQGAAARAENITHRTVRDWEIRLNIEPFRPSRRRSKHGAVVDTPPQTPQKQHAARLPLIDEPEQTVEQPGNSFAKITIDRASYQELVAYQELLAENARLRDIIMDVLLGKPITLTNGRI